MRRHRVQPGKERGIIIILVAVFMLFVVGAMAALSIDVVTLYTARSEAQLAADGAALAGARVLANSGMTSMSDPPFNNGAAEALASNIAVQVAQQNLVGGRALAAGQITVSFPNVALAQFQNNPHVMVQVRRDDLPTFFARIWGSRSLSVVATATAEAYNPSPPTGTTAAQTAPVAPLCVKPWLMPNIDPTNGNPIFDPAGRPNNTGLVGEAGLPAFQSATTAIPTAWKYFPGDPVDFPAPNASSVSCTGSVGFSAYQLSVAGCVPAPIACNASVGIDTGVDLTRDANTAVAVNCMAHSTNGAGDSIDPVNVPPLPFQFLAGGDNPLVQGGAIAVQTDIIVSDSLVTVPVFDNTLPFPPAKIVGFVQLFVNPDGTAAPATGVSSTVINLVGCGTTASGSQVFGNGASAVPVRLVSGQ